MSQTGGSAWIQLNSGNIIYGNDLNLGSVYMAGYYDHDGNYSTPTVMGFFKTTNNGTNWMKYTINEVAGTVNAFIVHPADNNILIAGGSKMTESSWMGCVFISTNGGIQWTEVGSDLFGPDWSVESVCMDPFNPDHLIAGSYYNTFFSTDGGTNWQKSNTSVGALCLGIDNGTPDRFFAGNWYGVYITTNGGLTWEKMTTEGMLDNYIKSIQYDHTNHTLFVGTNNGGVHRYTIATDVDPPEQDRESPDEYILFQNYPNPFNSETVIQYSIPQKSYVTIRIYNILGKEIRTIADGSRDSGAYTASWDGVDYSGSEVPSGIYVYRFKAGDFAETKKLILTR